MLPSTVCTTFDLCYTVIKMLLLQDCERYKLGDAASFHYLNQSSCIKLDGMDDASEYITTRRAMDIVGISSDEQVNRRLRLKLFYFI